MASPQNYYLYNDPGSGGFSFISWDHNYVLGVGKGGGGGGIPAFDKSGVNDDWPLISFVLAQPEYAALYRQSLQAIAGSVFVPERIEADLRGLQELIGPYVDGAEFEAAAGMLRARVHSRAADLAAHLAT
jgi:hypothetical protein